MIIFLTTQYQCKSVFPDFSPFGRFEIEPYDISASRDILRRYHLTPKLGGREFCEFICVYFFLGQIGQ